jgi:hypothetical protein
MEHAVFNRSLIQFHYLVNFTQIFSLYNSMTQILSYPPHFSSLRQQKSSVTSSHFDHCCDFCGRCFFFHAEQKLFHYLLQNCLKMFTPVLSFCAKRLLPFNHECVFGRELSSVQCFKFLKFCLKLVTNETKPCFPHGFHGITCPKIF